MKSDDYYDGYSKGYEAGSREFEGYHRAYLFQSLGLGRLLEGKPPLVPTLDPDMHFEAMVAEVVKALRKLQGEDV
jgi:hypothetical protein